GCAHDPLAHRPARYPLSDRVDFAGEHRSHALVAWTAEAKHEADDEGVGGAEGAIGRCGDAGVDAHPHLARSDFGYRPVDEAQDVGRAIAVADDGAHGGFLFLAGGWAKRSASFPLSKILLTQGR